MSDRRALLRTLPAIDKLLATTLLAELAKAEHDYIYKAFSTVASRKSAFSDYRKAVRQVAALTDKQRDHMFWFMRLKKVDSKEQKRLDNKGLKERKAELRPIADVDAYLDTAAQLLRSHSYLDNILGLAAATGRRISEIGVTAGLERVAEYRAFFTGQIKTRQAESTAHTRTGYEIPTLLPAVDVVSALNKLRRKKPDNAAPPNAPAFEIVEYCERFNSRVSTDLGRRCKKSFGADMKPKDLRAAYAEIQYAKEGLQDKAKDDRFSELLGHGAWDTNTGMRYFIFEITDPNYRWESRAAMKALATDEEE